MQSLRSAPRLVALLALAFAAYGCGESANTGPASPGPATGAASGATPRPGSGDRPGASSPIKDIMVRLASGPQSLTRVIGRGLETDPPAWDTLQQQTKEYAQLATAMSGHNPPRGSPESWAKLTASYAATATALDQAAQARDLDAASTAHQTLSSSCTACHREHRSMGRGGDRGPAGPAS